MLAASSIPTTLEPMEAKLVDALPVGDGWQFEPKWDGFRCLAFRQGGEVALMSKSGKPLQRFFPEVAAMLGQLDADRFVLDGELLIELGGMLSFDALQARLHPAPSRIAKLSAETPAQLMLFDCLEDRDRAWLDAPTSERRGALEALHAAERQPMLRLSPYTLDPAAAAAWLASSGGALDGIIAKRRDDRYRAGERAMLKLKQQRTADCVVGGFRYEAASRRVGSLLLGLYDDRGNLNHVGFTSAFADVDRPALTAQLEALIEPPGFTGKTPGGPSRWSNARSEEWQPLRAELVVEVRFDQVTSERFRHGTGLLRWRPDKAPRQCRMEQLGYALRPAELGAF